MKSDLASLAIDAVDRVEFFKRDELTTDLICCEITMRKERGGDVWFSHEDAPGWGDLLERIEKLPGFDNDWFAKVSQPPFGESRTVAFTR